MNRAFVLSTTVSGCCHIAIDPVIKIGDLRSGIPGSASNFKFCSAFCRGTSPIFGPGTRNILDAPIVAPARPAVRASLLYSRATVPAKPFGVECRYLDVVATLECPSKSRTFDNGTPPSIMCVAAECRKRCGQTSPTPAHAASWDTMR